MHIAPASTECMFTESAALDVTDDVSRCVLSPIFKPAGDCQRRGIFILLGAVTRLARELFECAFGFRISAVSATVPEVFVVWPLLPPHHRCSSLEAGKFWRSPKAFLSPTGNKYDCTEISGRPMKMDSVKETRCSHSTALKSSGIWNFFVSSSLKFRKMQRFKTFQEFQKFWEKWRKI